MRYIAACLILLILVGCSSSFYGKGRKLSEEGQYDRAIEAFYEEIARNPQSSEAWRELGVAAYGMGDLTKAEDALKQANAIKPDARTQLYLGLVYEKQGMADQAIDAYGTALSLDPGGKTGNVIRAHLDQLVSRRVQAEVDQALRDEESIDVSEIPDNTIGVVRFDNSHLSAELAPIAHGIAEFTAVDLAKVNSLRVVDRLKIDMILDELELSASGAVDPTTAPRLGKLLGTKHLVGGAIMDMGETGIRLNGLLVNTGDSSSEWTDPAEGKLDQIFRVQKDFVFSIIDDLGISLTAEERDAISEVPTESYLAFLAYCRGLDFQQRGFHRDAQASYNQAVQYDQGFGAAGDKSATLEASLSMGGADMSLGQFEAAAAIPGDVPQPTGGGVDTHLSGIAQIAGGLPDLGLGRAINLPPGFGQTSIVLIRVNLNVDLEI
jgi:tetratricopeptide (TPR) repeat protein